MQRKPKRSPERKPTHPGEMLKEIILPAIGRTKKDVARFLGISPQMLNGILAGRHAITPSMAVRFEAAFGASAESWIGMQVSHDIWQARRQVDVSTIPRLGKPELIGAS